MHRSLCVALVLSFLGLASAARADTILDFNIAFDPSLYRTFRTSRP
jgi:hypothetical protein